MQRQNVMVSENYLPTWRELCPGALPTQLANLRPSPCIGLPVNQKRFSCSLGSAGSGPKLEKLCMTTEEMGKGSCTGEALKKLHLTSPWLLPLDSRLPARGCHPPRPSSCSYSHSSFSFSLKQQGLVTQVNKASIHLVSTHYKQSRYYERRFGMPRVERWVRHGPCLQKG